MNDSKDRLSLTVLSSVEETTPKFLIGDYIVEGAINLLGGAGGAGKTFCWTNLAAAVSNGSVPSLVGDCDCPFDQKGGGKRILYLSAEDSTQCVLKKRLRLQGADLENILTIPVEDDRFSMVRFDSVFLKELIVTYRPALVVFDPVQSFVDPKIKMSDRNAMRQAMTPLIGYGQEFGTTFLVVVHCNKRTGAFARARLADSSDLWDIARSVLIVGETGKEGIRYLSQEKNNYGMLADTVLFSIENDRVVNRGHTTKRDRDFVLESDNRKRASPARDEAKRLILDALQNGEMLVSELDSSVKASGISAKTLRVAKESLKEERRIRYRKHSRGKGQGVEWFILLSE